MSKNEENQSTYVEEEVVGKWLPQKSRVIYTKYTYFQKW